MPPAAPRRAAVAPSGFRPEVQALRALAVALVLVFHLWPDALSGGYIGVDVFFVISGFLITGHLVREHAETGRIALARFWARRIRRLLPAAMLVLAASLLALLLLLPEGLWAQNLHQIAASALYLENWLLAADAVDYLAAENDPSMVQHYWSLSVEEQFYIVWPLLILGAALLARVLRRASAPRLRPVLVTVLALVALSSFGLGVWLTLTHPALAYFATPVRAWEFAAGGLLALLPSAGRRVPTALRAVAAWAGFAAMLGAGLVFDEQTPFPGVAAALPVLGAAAVIWAGGTGRAWSFDRLGAVRPVQWLGRISYSAYLWHWPPIVVLPVLLERGLLDWERAAVLGGTLLLAWATQRWIEDPVRFWSPLASAGSWRTYAAFGLSLALVLAPVVLTLTSIAQQAQQQEEEIEELVALGLADCLGAASLLQPAGACEGLLPEEEVFPSPASIKDDLPDVYSSRCRSQPDDPKLRLCSFGDPDSETVVMLAGDSHAASYMPALQRIAEQHGWRLLTAFKGSCPFIDPSVIDERSCRNWNDALRRRVLAMPSPPAVIVTSALVDQHWRMPEGTPRGASQLAVLAGASATYWQQFADRGSEFVVISDAPEMPQAAIHCVQRADSLEELRECGASASVALTGPDYLPVAAERLGAAFVDLRSQLCRQGWCPMLIGNVIAYRDDNSHLTETFSETLVPLLEPALLTVLQERVAVPATALAATQTKAP